MIDKLSPLIDSPASLSGSKPEKAGNTFAQSFKKIFDDTEKNLKEADEAVLAANANGKVNLHEMMIAMEKADISLRLLIQVRNKAVDAYQEIMRMQV